MRCSALLPVTAALIALAAVGGCASDSGGGAASPSGSPTAGPAEETISTAAALASFEAPSSQCAAMNDVLLTALAQTPQGQAYTAAPDGTPDRPVLWGAFAQALEEGYGAQLDEASSSDDRPARKDGASPPRGALAADHGKGRTTVGAILDHE